MGKEIWELIQEKLKEHGVDVGALCAEVGEVAGEALQMKVVVVAPDLRSSDEKMSKAPRDQVVMVRVSDETSRLLDAWVETGAVKSRSEAAALFIREGLQVRSGELEQLKGALRDVEKAKKNLRKKTEAVLGDRIRPEKGGSEESTDDATDE